MNSRPELFVFGEVLFDCFPNGEQVLGGAPFNVAWHLQALGNQPRLISRVGKDELGDKILTAMGNWGMETATVQLDPVNPTGQVRIKLINDEPHYTITPDSAYDFIEALHPDKITAGSILYHGSLGLRNTVSHDTFKLFANRPELSIFLDVNLRNPWWNKDDTYGWLKQARWVKLNEDEMGLLGFLSTDLKQDMTKLLSRFNLEQLIVTRGSQGALILDSDGKFYHQVLEPVSQIVDTVGAGDAFSAMFIHGLLSAWSVPSTLEIAQKFASKVVGLRGAVSTDPDFYQDFID